MKLGKLLHSYVFWTYERGSLHYDVMVTLILVFIFGSPFFINYKDKPQPELPSRSGQVLIKPVGQEGSQTRLMCELRADDLHHNANDQTLQADALRLIEPIAGPVHIEKVQPVLDGRKQTVAYDIFVLR